MGNSYISNPRETIHIESTSYCNLNCVFCAYGKKSTPKINVSIEHFKNYREVQSKFINYQSMIALALLLSCLSKTFFKYLPV